MKHTQEAMRQFAGGNMGCGATGTPQNFLYLEIMSTGGAKLAADPQACTGWFMSMTFSNFPYGESQQIVNTGSKQRCWVCGNLLPMQKPYLIHPIVALMPASGGGALMPGSGGGPNLPLKHKKLLSSAGDTDEDGLSRQRDPDKPTNGVQTSTFMAACNVKEAELAAAACDPARGTLPDWYARSGNMRICVHGIGRVGSCIPHTSVPCAPVSKHPLVLEFERKFPQRCAAVNQIIGQWHEQYEESRGFPEDDSIEAIIPLLRVP